MKIRFPASCGYHNWSMQEMPLSADKISTDPVAGVIQFTGE